MKKVIVFQAKDGSTHATPKLCKEQDAKLLLAPAIAAFVVDVNERERNASGDGFAAHFLVHLEEIITTNADALRKALTEPLITRRPRKAKPAKLAAVNATT